MGNRVQLDFTCLDMSTDNELRELFNSRLHDE